jgi:hypothetical protein
MANNAAWRDDMSVVNSHCANGFDDEVNRQWTNTKGVTAIPPANAPTTPLLMDSMRCRKSNSVALAFDFVVRDGAPAGGEKGGGGGGVDVTAAAAATYRPSRCRSIIRRSRRDNLGDDVDVGIDDAVAEHVVAVVVRVSVVVFCSFLPTVGTIILNMDCMSLFAVACKALVCRRSLQPEVIR